MLAAEAGLRPVADFILFVAGGGERRLRVLQHEHAFVLRRQNGIAVAHAAGERRVFA